MQVNVLFYDWNMAVSWQRCLLIIDNSIDKHLYVNNLKVINAKCDYIWTVLHINLSTTLTSHLLLYHSIIVALWSTYKATASMLIIRHEYLCQFLYECIW